MENVLDDFEVLDADGLAAKLKRKKRWVELKSRPSEEADPIPAIKLGRVYRYLWGSPELTAWLLRRSNHKPTSRAVPARASK
jgi:hypothetical protein